MRRPAPEGFSLIELVALLVILGLIALTVGLAGAGGSTASRQRRAMEDLAALVSLARAEAMKLSSVQSVEIEATGGDLSFRAGERERSWTGVGLVIAGRGRTVAETPRREIDRLQVAFDGLGRTRDRVIVFDGTGGDPDEGQANRGRMWALGFDPVSGAVHVEIVGDRRTD